MTLRLALLLDRTVVNETSWDFLSWCAANPQLELVGTYLAPAEAESSPAPHWLVRFERNLLRQKSPVLNPRERHPLSIHPAEAIRRAQRLTGTPEAQLKQLGSGRPDIVVYLGNADTPPLDTPSCSQGILAVQPLDDRKAWAGFTPVLRGLDVSRVAIRHFRDGHCEDLLVSSFATKYFHRWNAAELQLKGLFLLRHALESLIAGKNLPGQSPAAPPPAPSPLDWLRYSLRLGKRLAGKWLARKLDRDYRWQVAYSACDWSELEPASATFIANPPGHFLADPFLFEHDGRTYCFVEDFDEALGRAGISVYELGPDGANRLGEALTEPFHLSFPHVFAHDGAIYMNPESADSQEIRLYRATDFPLRWELAKVLKSGQRYADTLLFEQDARWWMLTNPDPGQSGDFGSVLEIHSADHLLSDDWTAHPANPIHIDALCGRNAGLLRSAEKIFRPCQQQGFDLYGKSFEIREITALNRQTYAETPVRQITASFARGLAGTHHISSTGRYTAFDVVTRCPIKRS